jgi:hypothetical protein
MSELLLYAGKQLISTEPGRENKVE